MREEEAFLYKLDHFDNMELLSATYIDQKFPMHCHDTFCIGILEEGSEIVSISNNDLIIPANSVIIINPEEAHANYALDDYGWKYKMMYINPDVLKFASSLIGKWTTQILFKEYSIQDEVAFNYVKSFFDGLEHKSSSEMEIQLRNLVSYLITNYSIKNLEISKNDRYTDRSEDVKFFLDEKFDTKLNLDDIADSMHTNKFKLIREFKKSTGLTPMAYVLHKRVQKSKQLIGKNIPLVQVALEAGFYDQSHFTKYFKSYVGVTPLSYVRSCNILQDFNKY